MSAAANDDNNAGPTPAPREVRTVLLLGRTGSGKSSLGNLLCGVTARDVDEPFKVGHFAASETKEHKCVDLPLRDYQFDLRIVDTIGASDTAESNEAVLLRVARAIHDTKGSIHQILFCVSDRFTEEQASTFREFISVLLDHTAPAFTTIVRTKFEGFADADMCEGDKASFASLKDGPRTMIAACAGVVWVDSTNLESRRAVLDRIAKCDESYAPPAFTQAEEQIRSHIEELKRQETVLLRLQQEIADLKKAATADEAALRKLKQQEQQAIVAAETARAEGQAAILEAMGRLPPAVFVDSSPLVVNIYRLGKLAFHAGVVVGNCEYFFAPQRIRTCRPGKFNSELKESLRFPIILGDPKSEFDRLVNSWADKSYSVLDCNCCSFAEDVAVRLTGQHLPVKYMNQRGIQEGLSQVPGMALVMEIYGSLFGDSPHFMLGRALGKEVKNLGRRLLSIF